MIEINCEDFHKIINTQLQVIKNQLFELKQDGI